MWLERFIFCGKTIGPTNNTLKMAETLAGGNPVPLGKHLLGSVYHLLHQVSATPTSVVSINGRWSYPGLNTKWYLKNYLFRWMERPKNLLRPGYWSWYCWQKPVLLGSKKGINLSGQQPYRVHPISYQLIIYWADIERYRLMTTSWSAECLEPI